MANITDGVGSATNWGQTKKSGTSPTPTEPVPTEPETPQEATVSAKIYAGSVQITPMGDSLRQMIAAQSTDGVAPSTLSALSSRLAEAELALHGDGLSTEAIQRTRADIIADASRAMLAQANHSRDSVLAILNLD